MHPEITRTIAAQQMQDSHAAAAAARLARRAREGRARVSPTLTDSGSVAGRRNLGWRRLAGRRRPGRPQPA